MDDIVGAWKTFRDPQNGFWCDSMWLSDYQTPCGPSNNFYSSAGTGMGLVSEAIMTELGERDRVSDVMSYSALQDIRPELRQRRDWSRV